MKRSAALFLLLMACIFSASPGQAARFSIEEQNESGLRIRLDDPELMLPAGSSSLASRGAILQQSGDRAWLSQVLQIALPPGQRAVLRMGDLRTAEVAIPAPANMEEGLVLAGPVQPGVRLLESGWMRGQKIQRVAVDLAVYHGGWQLLDELSFELRFVTDAAERLSASAPLRSWRESPAIEELLDHSLLNSDQARGWRVDPARLSGSVIQRTASENPALADETITRIMVREDGIHRVTGAELEDAGIDLAQIATSSLRLWSAGEEVPLIVQDGGDGSFDRQDRLIFIGRYRRGEAFPTSFFSPDQAYFLSWNQGTGRRYLDLSVPPLQSLEAQTQFVTRRHYEQNRTFNLLEDSELSPMESDHWFWQSFTAIGGPAWYNLNLDLEHALGGSFERPDRIRYAMRGITTSVTSGSEHHAILRVDGQWAGDFTSPNQEEAITDWYPLPDSTLAGKALVSLEVELPLDHGADSDLIYLNWIQLEHARAIVQESGRQLEIPSGELLTDRNTQLAAEDAGNLLLLAEDGRRLLGGVLVGDTLRFHLDAASTALFISSWDDLLVPASIERTANAHLHDPDQQADMLIIAPTMYHDELQDLVDYHSAQYTVRLLDIESIYCEFSEGLMHSRAIKDFLKYTMLEWQAPAPSYVTLVGKASRANQIELTSEPLYRTQVPSWWTQTFTTGSTSNDEEFALLVGEELVDDGRGNQVIVDDMFQDLMVGRISVATETQLVDFLEKHREYREAEFAGEWMETQVLASDEAGGSEDEVFEVGNQLVAQYIVPEAFPVKQIHVRDNSPWEGGALDMIDMFNDGCTVLNYNGHGAIGVMSSSSLFRSTDIRFLSNRGMYPIGFAWSCLVGYYDSADTSSMAELLLRQRRAGGIAFYGSAGKATIRVDNPLMTHYFANQYAEEAFSFGQIVQLTENSMRAMSGAEDIVRMYNLQGDPALVPALPRGKLDTGLPYLIVDGGGEVRLGLSSNPVGASGDLTIRYLPDRFLPANHQSSLRRSWNQSWTDGDSLVLALPETDEPHYGMLQFGINDNGGRSVGALPVFLNTPYAGLGDHYPDRPSALNPFEITLNSVLDPDSVVLETNILAQRYLTMQRIGEGEFRSYWSQLPPNYSDVSGLPSPNYTSLTESMLEDWGLTVADFPSFSLYGLVYRFLIYDREDFTDANGNGSWDAGEDYLDANGNGQYDPYGEPFTDLNGDGRWQAGEPFEDLNSSNQRDSYISLPGRFVRFDELESIQAVDSSLTVLGSTSPLGLKQRWLLSASRSIDSAAVRITDQLRDTSLFAGDVPAAAGVQDLLLELDLNAGANQLLSEIGPLYHAGILQPGFDTLSVEDHFWLLHPEYGAGEEAIDPAGHWSLELAAGALPAAVQLDPVLHASGLPALREASEGQPGLGILLLEGESGDLRALDLAPRREEELASVWRPQNSTLDCEIPSGSRFQFPDGILGDSLKLGIARWIAGRGLWVLQPGTAELDGDTWRLSSQLSLASGWLAPVAITDETGPELALQVSGQWFAAGDVVVREPVFQFQLNDVNGLDLGEGTAAPVIHFDGSLVDAAELRLDEGTTSLLLSWSPGLLDEGSEHSFELTVYDALGNASTLESSFRVATKLDLEFFANHPNPFSDQTIFAWSLSNLPQDLRFEIFTPSGRKIRTIRVSNPRIGYDELVWDGRDDKGRQVANGAYFLRVVAGGSTGSIDKVYKLARLQ